MGSLALLEREVFSSPQVQATQLFDSFATDDQVTTGKRRHRVTRKIRRQIDAAFTEHQVLAFIRDMPEVTIPTKSKKRRWQPRRPSTHRPVGYSSTYRNSEAKANRKQRRHSLKPCVGITPRTLEDELADFAEI